MPCKNKEQPSGSSCGESLNRSSEKQAHVSIDYDARSRQPAQTAQKRNMQTLARCRSIFDFIVVASSLITPFIGDAPVPISIFRLMRAFRVLRIFGRLKVCPGV